MAYQYPAAPVGAIFQVRLNMDYNGQRYMNTYTWRLEQNANADSVLTISNQMDANFALANNLYATHRALREGSLMLNYVEIQSIAPRYVAVRYGKGETGGAISTTTDIGVIACNITRRGVSGTRKDVSSLHIPVPAAPEAILNDNWTAGYIVLLTAHCGVVQSDLTLSGGATLKPVIYHKNLQPNYSYIGACFFQPYVRTMRRRVVGRGI